MTAGLLQKTYPWIANKPKSAISGNVFEILTELARKESVDPQAGDVDDTDIEHKHVGGLVKVLSNCQ